MVKICAKCLVEKPLSEFSLRKSRGNRPNSYCKPCHRSLCRKSAMTPEAYAKKLKYSKDYWRTKEGREKRLAGARKYFNSNSVKAVAAKKRRATKQKQSGEVAAKVAIRRALKAEVIFRKNICCACFKENIKTHFHHYIDYKPEHYLDVVELCYTCHYEAHAEPDHEYYPRTAHVKNPTSADFII